ncbi:MAG: cob(I)yrinic acid a,c-diamide adenosyltransferase [Ruminococcus sp.]|nr:cob(I)yrinic acid a,c-diamide adenosyltransferase [Ruminococcus sp.]
MIHIYSGNGKGKTTAAVGLAVRAVGAGLRVHFCQFLKNGDSNEINILKQLNNMTVGYCEECRKFTFQMNDDEKNIVKNTHNKLLNEIESLISQNSIDVVVMDEIFKAYNSALLDQKKVREIVYNCPKHIELILTGRSPSKVFKKAADYYSVIRAVKHPYNNGIKARKGIEY